MKKKNKQTKTNKTAKILNQILINQRNIMIWISSDNKPYWQGYFAFNIKDTEELLK